MCVCFDCTATGMFSVSSFFVPAVDTVLLLLLPVNIHTQTHTHTESLQLSGLTLIDRWEKTFGLIWPKKNFLKLYCQSSLSIIIWRNSFTICIHFLWLLGLRFQIRKIFPMNKLFRTPKKIMKNTSAYICVHIHPCPFKPGLGASQYSQGEHYILTIPQK